MTWIARGHRAAKWQVCDSKPWDLSGLQSCSLEKDLEGCLEEERKEEEGGGERERGIGEGGRLSEHPPGSRTRGGENM